MDTTYGNRIPPAYRWAVAALVFVPLAFLGWAAAAGLVSPTPAFLVILLGVGFVAAYWKAGTTVSVSGETVRLRLFPLWSTRVRVDQIQTIAVEPVAPSAENGATAVPCGATVKSSSTPDTRRPAWPSIFSTAP